MTRRKMQQSTLTHDDNLIEFTYVITRFCSLLASSKAGIVISDIVITADWLKTLLSTWAVEVAVNA